MILALESSTEIGGVALIGKNGAVRWEKSFTAPKAQNVEIFPVLEEALNENAGGAIDAIVVGVGPGSHNGVRIAIAIAEAFSLSLQTRLVGMPSFLAVPEVFAGEEILFVGDARRGDFFAIECGKGKQLSELEMMDQAALIKRLEERGGGVSFDRPERFSSPELIRQVVPEAGLLGRVFHEQGDEASRVCEPFYLRPPQVTISKKPPPKIGSARRQDLLGS